jgi:hypothetical protein
MIPADELVARADTNTSWESMMTHELAEEILERSITREEWDVIRDTLDDNVYETLMSFR